MIKVEFVKYKKKIIAIIIPKKVKIKKKIQFLTDNKEEFQIALMNRYSSDNVKPHFHPNQPRKLKYTSEFIWLLSGRAVFTFYAPLKKKIKLKSKILKTGDSVCFLNCGHSIKFLTKTKLLEVKQGPYKTSKDKTFIEVS